MANGRPLGNEKARRGEPAPRPARSIRSAGEPSGPRPHDFVKVRPVAFPPAPAGVKTNLPAASSLTLPTSGGPSAWSRARVPSLKPDWPVEGLLLALAVDLPGELAVGLERQRDRQVGRRLGLPGPDQAGRRRGRGLLVAARPGPVLARAPAGPEPAPAAGAAPAGWRRGGHARRGRLLGHLLERLHERLAESWSCGWSWTTFSNWAPAFSLWPWTR